jgi:adenine-specific DNA methylase/DNA modification methylase
MVTHRCDNCQKVFAQKCRLDNHNKRKRPCKKNTLETVAEQNIQEASSTSPPSPAPVPIDDTDLSKKTREELITLCKYKKINSYSGKKKNQLIELLSGDVKKNTPIVTIRYLGCKQKLLEFLDKSINACYQEIGKETCVLFDAFCGTGTVSSHFASKGYNVIACDILSFSSVLTKCLIGITIKDLSFKHIIGESMTPIDDILLRLNTLEGQGDYITQTYTPVGNRMYFTENNGRKIDAIRNQIEQWLSTSHITPLEHDFLVGCLIVAVSRVSNTAGTYGAFNKKWDVRSEKPLSLFNPFPLTTNGVVLNADVSTVLSNHQCDILYLDPPYNERQYGNYYHVLETIVRNDKPEVKGVTGLRDWSDTKSNFCVASKVENELDTLLRLTNASFVVMSYNNEGHLSKDKIIEIMSKYGTVQCEDIPYERYNRVKGKGSDIVEYIFTLNKTNAPSKNVIIVPDQPVSIPINLPLPTWHNTIFHSDCIVGMKALPEKSIDLILTDLPYGLTECKWDSIIPLKELWEQYKRLIKPTGAIVLFGQQPFSSMLVSSNYEMFKYSLVWKKTKTGNFAQAPYRFLCEHEDILVFSYGKVTKNGNPRMTYNPQGTTECNKTMKGKTGTTSHREGRATQSDYVQTVTNYPRSILEFGSEGKAEHPTQKPIELCKYLIRTYTNQGDIVLDSCMGSGTTAVAAVQTGRTYVGYEKEEKYYQIGIERLKNA